MDNNVLEQYQAQEALQGQQIDGQMSPYAPQIQEAVQQTQAILVDQTNPKRIVREVILRLRGLEEKPDGTLVQVAEPKVNKEGIDNIWFILDSHINQNVILSHLDKGEIAKMIDTLQGDIVDDLSLNWRRYGIQKKTDLDAINDAILFNIYLALKRAEGQNEKNWLGKISIENISGGSRIPMPKKEGFWSKFRL